MEEEERVRRLFFLLEISSSVLVTKVTFSESPVRMNDTFVTIDHEALLYGCSTEAGREAILESL